MSFEGSCHCGAVAFTVAADLPDAAVSCNCSHCRRKGLLLAFFPAETFAVTRGEEMLRSYTFNTHTIRHQFCETCGAQPFAFGAGAGGAPMRAVNLRCVPDLDLSGLTLQEVDGANS